SSSLQPARKSAQAARRKLRVSEALIFIAHLGYKLCANALEKLGSFREAEFCVRGLDADEETVVRGALETRDGEQRTVRLRKFVQREHSEDGARRSSKNRQLEGNRHECRPAIQVTAG